MSHVGQMESAAIIHPLDGIRVLDLSRVLAGPWCGMILGDLGADIIKVENPDGGDDTRRWGASVGGSDRTYYLSCNRNKRSIAVDISTPDGQEIVRELACKSDVLIENYKLHGLRKFGLEWESLRKINPRLIYCSVSGYGRTGPSAARLGYDVLVQGESGLMSVTGDADGSPYKVGVPIADILTGNYAVQAILAALIARGRTGAGQFIDIALHDSTLASLGPMVTNALLLDKEPRRYGNSHPYIMPYELFTASDGEVIIAVGNDAQFLRLCLQVLECPNMSDDERFSTNAKRCEYRSELRQAMSQILANQPREFWLERLSKAQVPAGAVRSIGEALRSQECLGREMIQLVDHPHAGPMKFVASPLKLRGTPVCDPKAPPLLGQHTDEVLRSVLMTAEDRIQHLRKTGIVR